MKTIFYIFVFFVAACWLNFNSANAATLMWEAPNVSYPAYFLQLDNTPELEMMVITLPLPGFSVYHFGQSTPYLVSDLSPLGGGPPPAYDFDGDGRLEIVCEYQFGTPESPLYGFKLVDAEFGTVDGELAPSDGANSAFPNQGPSGYLDANGDGVMDILVSGKYWNSSSSQEVWKRIYTFISTTGVPSSIPTTIPMHVAPQPVSGGGGVVSFIVPRGGVSELCLYDSAGRQIKSILGPRMLSPGSYSVSMGNDLPPGVYYLHLRGDMDRATAKMVVIR